jgi:hypothetical protein
MLHGTMMMQITIWTRLGDQWEHIYIHSSITINCDAIFITRFLFFLFYLFYIFHSSTTKRNSHVTLIRMGCMKLIYIHRPATTSEHGWSLEWPTIQVKRTDIKYYIYIWLIQSIEKHSFCFFAVLIIFLGLYSIAIIRWCYS